MHASFWSRKLTLPVDDPFWGHHHPGERWGCKCTCEQTDEPVNDLGMNGHYPDTASKGLHGNPAETGHLFSEDHPYYPKNCGSCPFRKGVKNAIGQIFNAKKDCSQCKACMTVLKESSPQYQRNAELCREYSNNPEYRDVSFDKKSGGMKATHIGHNFDKNKGQYEVSVQNVGFQNGHSVVFESERNGAFGERFTEGLWDGYRFEIAGAETATKNNILRGLKHCAAKRVTQVAVLYYPNGGFDRTILQDAVKRYRGLEKLQDGQFLEFKKIVCIQKTDIFEFPL